MTESFKLVPQYRAIEKELTEVYPTLAQYRVPEDRPTTSSVLIRGVRDRHLTPYVDNDELVEEIQDYLLELQVLPALEILSENDILIVDTAGDVYCPDSLAQLYTTLIDSVAKNRELPNYSYVSVFPDTLALEYVVGLSLYSLSMSVVGNKY